MLVWKVLRKPKSENEIICEKILKEIYTHELDIQIHSRVEYDIDSYFYEIIENKQIRKAKLEKKYNELCDKLLDSEYSNIYIIPSDCNFMKSLYVVYKPEIIVQYSNEWLNYWGNNGFSVKCLNI